MLIGDVTVWQINTFYVILISNNKLLRLKIIKLV